MPDPVMLGSPTNTQPPIHAQVVTVQPGMMGGGMQGGMPMQQPMMMNNGMMGMNNMNNMNNMNSGMMRMGGGMNQPMMMNNGMGMQQGMYNQQNRMMAPQPQQMYGRQPNNNNGFFTRANQPGQYNNTSGMSGGGGMMGGGMGGMGGGMGGMGGMGEKKVRDAISDVSTPGKCGGGTARGKQSYCQADQK
eukprot:gene27571-33300_t